MTHRTSRFSLLASALCALAALALAPARADAGELDVAVGAGAGLGSWRNDFFATTSLTAGYRFRDLAEIYVGTRVGYATIDERMITAIQLGGKLWGRVGIFRPYMRVGLVHQHEESISAVAAEPAGALFGVGDGIRHRAGADFALGSDVRLLQMRSWQLYAGAEAVLTWFPDPRGPTFYGGGLALLGVRYGL